MLQRIKSFLVWGCLTGEGSLSRQRFFRILRVCERESAFSPLDSLTHVHVSLAVSFFSAWEPWHAGVSMPPSPALDQQQDSFWLKIQMHKLQTSSCRCQSKPLAHGGCRHPIVALPLGLPHILPLQSAHQGTAWLLVVKKHHRFTPSAWFLLASQHSPASSLKELSLLEEPGSCAPAGHKASQLLLLLGKASPEVRLPLRFSGATSTCCPSHLSGGTCSHSKETLLVSGCFQGCSDITQHGPS